MQDEFYESPRPTEAKLRKIAPFAKASAIVVAVAAAVDGLFIAEDVLEYPLTAEIDIDFPFYTGIAAVVLELLSYLVVGRWIYLAHANLHAEGLHKLEYTPGWAIGWYLIPIANLFKPFQAMRELWNRSNNPGDAHVEPGNGFLWLWWLTWLGGGLVSFGDFYNWLDVWGQVLTVISACCVWVLISTISQSQQSFSVAETFR